MRKIRQVILLLLSLNLAACQQTGTSIQDTSSISGDWQWRLPPNFPTPAVPADNPMSEAKFQLGRHLFYDKRLSGNGTFACASCHHQDKAFTDGKMLSIGSTGQTLPRNAPSLVNTAYHATYTWVNPNLTDLETQMHTPLFASDIVEMGITEDNLPSILQRFKDLPLYHQLFAAAFPQDSDPIHMDNIIKAIATFERALLTGNSKLEKYMVRQAQLTPAEERGRILFNGETAECFHCHGSFNFNDQVNFLGKRPEANLFHNTGLYNIDGHGAFPANNQGLITFSEKDSDMGAFRAQSLWNVAVTAPYMHDGSLATLEEVLDFYAAGGRLITTGPNAGDGRNNPYKSDLVGLINLTEEDKADIIAFLKTLTDEDLLVNPRFANPFP